MRTQTGKTIIIQPPVSGFDGVSLIFVDGKTPSAIHFTREEAAELGRQLVTVAHGRRMILTPDVPAVLESPT